jgi:hypothetical protein
MTRDDAIKTVDEITGVGAVNIRAVAALLVEICDAERAEGVSLYDSALVACTIDQLRQLARHDVMECFSELAMMAGRHRYSDIEGQFNNNVPALLKVGLA